MIILSMSMSTNPNAGVFLGIFSLIDFFLLVGGISLSLRPDTVVSPQGCQLVRVPCTLVSVVQGGVPPPEQCDLPRLAFK